MFSEHFGGRFDGVGGLFRFVLGFVSLDELVKHVDEANFAGLFKLAFLFIDDHGYVVFELGVLFFKGLYFWPPLFQKVDKFAPLLIIVIHMIVQKDLRPAVEIPHDVVQVLVDFFFHLLTVDRKIKPQILQSHFGLGFVNLLPRKRRIR